MATFPSKVRDRVAAGIKKYQPILSSAKSRDVNESDTVTIVKDMLAEIFGFDKYSEITSEYAIRGTFVDLAIKLNRQVQMLIEVKAIGLELKDSFIKQAVDYGSNKGVDWVVLTNGVTWQIYKLYFKKPIDKELVVELSIMDINHRNMDDGDKIFLITKEGLEKSSLDEYDAKRQALSRYYIGQMLMTDTVLDVIKRELRRTSPDVKIDAHQIKEVLTQEILKRDIIEGEKADEAKRKIMRAANRALRRANREQDNNGLPSDEKNTSSEEIAEQAILPSE